MLGRLKAFFPWRNSSTLALAVSMLKFVGKNALARTYTQRTPLNE